MRRPQIINADVLPIEREEHIHIGPNDAPCCFIDDQLTTGCRDYRLLLSLRFDVGVRTAAAVCSCIICVRVAGGGGGVSVCCCGFELFTTIHHQLVNN